MTWPRVVEAGDSAVLVEFGDRIDVTVNARALRLARAIERERAGDGRWAVPIPAYASVLVGWDPLRLDADEALSRIRSLADRAAAAVESDADHGGDDGELVEVAVRYGGPEGPDLAHVAELHGLRPADVVDLHAGTIYRVYFLGFLPGFAYLGTVPAEIATPRRESPRARVLAGSVGIAGDQAGIYPLDSPGGWQILGRTNLRLWDPAADPPARLGPGMRVRFVPERR